MAGRWLGTVMVMGIVSWLAPTPAEACSPAPCSPGELVPGPGSTVPANLTALSWLGFQGEGADVTAARVAGGVETPVSATLTDTVITLGEPLVEGAQYVVRASLGCGVGGPVTIETNFMVGPAAAPASALGTLMPTDIGIGPVSAITYIGSCSLEVDSDRTRIELLHDASATPWRDAFAYETWVDGVRWRPTGSLGGIVGPPSGSWIGRGTDVVYAVCFDTDLVEPEGLPEGSHLVELRARVAGESAVLATPSVSVTLDCTGYEAPDGGGVGYARPDTGAPLDAGTVDAGASDAGGMDAGVDDAGVHGGSMGCAASPGGRGSIAGLVIALALWARRRAR